MVIVLEFIDLYTQKVIFVRFAQFVHLKRIDCNEF